MTDEATFQGTTPSYPPTDLRVAADVIGGLSHQRVKVEFGVDGSATDVSSSAPLPVVQTGTPALPTGAATAAKQPALGTAGTPSADVLSVQGAASMTPVTAGLRQVRIVPAAPTISAASIYASGDAVGGKLTFPNAARVSGGTITITMAIIVDKDQELAPLELVLFNDDFTAVGDNAAFDPTDADLAAKFIGVVKISDYASFFDNAVATRECRFTTTLVATSVYGQLVTRSTPTYTATDDIVVGIQVIQD